MSYFSDSISKVSSFPLSPKGDLVKIKTNDSRHYGDIVKPHNVDEVSESFAATLKKSLEKVNDLEVEADSLTQKLVFDPNSVDAHQVMIASEKARIAVTFTKTLVDGVIKAYRDLSNLR
jgi:flagellar hook-basal body complex protein FliE